ncbi:MAG: hypothetical protein ACREOU_09670 [Candidatus Eiseniibacteriota bacterium]
MRGKGSRRRARALGTLGALGLGFGFALALALALALAGCGNQDGSLTGYAPEGLAGQAFTVADVVLADFSPTTTRVTLYVNNTGLATDSYHLAASSDPTFTAITLPPGWSVTFLDSAFTPVTQTAAIVDSGNAVIYADVTIPIFHPAGPVQVYFQALSVLSTTADVLHASIDVGVTYGRTTVHSRDGSALQGTPELAVDLTAGAPLPGGSGAGPGPEIDPVVTVPADLGPRAAAAGVVFDSSGANGMRFYFNPGDQGYRPGTDYITRPAVNFSTGWSSYVGLLQGFDSFAGNWVVGRGARDGIESSGAVVSREAYVPEATPIELASRSEVTIISPRAPEATPDAFPTVFAPFTLQWSGFPGAAAYFVQVIGGTGPVAVAYTGGAQGDPGAVFLENQELRRNEVYFWDVVAVDVQHRVNGFSFDRGSFLFTVPVDVTINQPLPNGVGVDVGPEATPVVSNTTTPGSTTRFTVYVNNISSADETYGLAASTDPEFGTLALPPGWAVVFRNSANNPVTNTGEVLSEEEALIFADVVVPAGASEGSTSLYFRARSSRRDDLGRNAEDRIHAEVNVGFPGPLARNSWAPALASSSALNRRPAAFRLQPPGRGEFGVAGSAGGAGPRGGRTMIARPEHSLAARLGLLEQAAARANGVRRGGARTE